MASWRRTSRLFSAVVLLLNMLEVASVNNVKQYGFVSRLPKSILATITSTNNDLRSEAHILRPTIKPSPSGAHLSFNLSVLPVYFENISITTELFLKFKTQNTIGLHPSAHDLWIKEWPSGTPLARVALGPSKIGFRSINVGKIVAKWLKAKQSKGVLSIKIQPSPSPATTFIALKPSPYLVAFTHSLTSPPLPKPVKCHDHVIFLPTADDIVLPRRFQTKICSSLNDVSFPFNASSTFDVGQAVRSYLTTKPISRNSRVLRNPPCCHAVRSAPLNFMTLQKGVQQIENAKITKCGCQDD